MKAIPLWVKLLGGIGILAAVCVGLAFVPTGDVAYAPNAPISLDGKIQVDGRPVEPLQGQLYLVGVTERKVNLLQRLLLDVSDPDIDFGPAPEGTSGGGPAPADVRSMSEAKQVAAGVAFDLTPGRHTDWEGSGAVVDDIAPNSPAAATLRRGDLILQVDGVPVDTSVEAGRLINQHAPGTVVTLGVQRAGTPVRPQLRTLPPEAGDEDRRSRIGAALTTSGLKVHLPRNVAIDSGDVVGPSAGLAFALYLYDALDAHVDLLGGRYVVVTGALAPDGQVLPVGRVRQKAIAAQAANRDLMVVPRANADEARQAIAAACGSRSSCVQVVPVRSAMEAVRLLSLQPGELASHLAQASGSSASPSTGA